MKSGSMMIEFQNPLITRLQGISSSEAMGKYLLNPGLAVSKKNHIVYDEWQEQMNPTS